MHGFFPRIGRFFNRLFRLTRRSARATPPAAEDCPVDPAEFASLIKSGKRQDFEKLARMLSSRPDAQDRPGKRWYLRGAHAAGDNKHRIDRH